MTEPQFDIEILGHGIYVITGATIAGGAWLLENVSDARVNGSEATADCEGGKMAQSIADIAIRGWTRRQCERAQISRRQRRRKRVAVAVAPIASLTRPQSSDEATAGGRQRSGRAIPSPKRSQRLPRAAQLDPG